MPIIRLPGKPRRYRNEPVMSDGHKFQSMAEATRYGSLKLQLLAGMISNLTVHPSYPLFAGNEYVGRYTADFRYIDRKSRQFVVEDVKSNATRKDTAYRLRRQLMRANYGVDIVEHVVR